MGLFAMLAALILRHQAFFELDRLKKRRLAVVLAPSVLVVRVGNFLGHCARVTLAAG
jgi:hypothetical protein